MTPDSTRQTLGAGLVAILYRYMTTDVYNDSVNLLRLSSNEENVLNVFHQMDVNTPGRAMSYLTLMYRMSHILKEETVRKAVRLAAPVLRNAGRVEASFIRSLCSGKYWSLNLWDIF